MKPKITDDREDVAEELLADMYDEPKNSDTVPLFDRIQAQRERRMWV